MPLPPPPRTMGIATPRGASWALATTSGTRASRHRAAAIDGGEDITCRWFNVPEHENGYGRITVIKYACATMTYVSNVDCEIYEEGQAFDLVFWDGDSWEYADTKTTDGGGQVTWTEVEPGQYWLDEPDGDWCHLASDQLSEDGHWFDVAENQETVVKVYNCASDPGDQGKPGKTPMKYPNTGVPQDRWDQP